jgi:hypothetical protein
MTFLDAKITKRAANHLASIHGPSQIKRIERGVAQAAWFWTPADGSPDEFVSFCSTHFIADTALLAGTLGRMEGNLESLSGHAAEASREIRVPMDLDIGPMLPVDGLFAGFATDAHLNEDLFGSKVAFAALLNFEQATLEDKIRFGVGWTREQWAGARIADAFSARVPSDAKRAATFAYTEAENYINGYNLCMHHLLDPDGRRPFPAGMRLISHWNLRDELKARYADPDGLAKQRMIALVMEKIVRQEVPAAVVDNPFVDWRIDRNTVAPSPVKDLDNPGKTATTDNAPEPDTRYAKWLGVFNAERRLDAFWPSMPSLIDRRFGRDREMSEARVESLLVSVLESGAIRRTGRLIERRLGRPLEAFDVWYNGFKGGPSRDEADLDRVVAKRYPDRNAFQADLPRILRRLEFPAATADFLASKIVVDPARGIGHAMEPGTRSDKARLRTRIGRGGMDFKGYNIAVHELGHNCEQVLTLDRMDHVALRGVPGTAFTEAFAFTFQSRDLDLLGLGAGGGNREEALSTLDVLWSVYEIAGVSLVDMRSWRWLYGHPEATPAEFKAAVIGIARSVWNDYFSAVLGVRDSVLLAVYSHLVDSGLYLPDYPLGHLISFQIENYMKGKKVGEEMERMCKAGAVTPDLWMRNAVGDDVSSKPLLDAAEKALAGLD